MSKISKFISDVIVREGGYVNNPDDSGGPTKYGITKNIAYKYGYRGDMSEFPKEDAIAIYKSQYWLEPGFDKIERIDESLADMMMEFGALAGPMTAVKMLQRALNVLNRNGVDYPDIKQDGIIGPLTVHCLDLFIGRRRSEGKRVLRGMIAAQFSVHIIECAEKSPRNEQFEYGWQLCRVIGAFL